MLAFFYILLASLLALLGLWALGYGRAGPTGGLWDCMGSERLKPALQKPALQNRMFRSRRLEAGASEQDLQKPILQDKFVLQKSF